MATTIFDSWQKYTEGCTAPQLFIDFSFYFMISAALQRRVWLGEGEAKLYPNIYVVLIGPPGVGKGIAMNPAKSILQSFKKASRLKDADLQNLMKVSSQDETNEVIDKIKASEEFSNLLLAAAADATTYESLVQDNAKSITSVKYREGEKNRIYSHCSMYFCLAEMGNLFQKDQSRLTNYLQDAYDCGNHRYKTKTKGEDCVFNTCLSLMGGTTPAWLQDSMMEKIIGEGFSSRSFFVYSPTPRFYSFDNISYNTEQIEARKIVVDHVKKLTTAYGGVRFSADAHEYCSDYVTKSLGGIVASSPPDMAPYLSRKPVHIKKLSTILHFSEEVSFDKEIQLGTVQRAMAILEGVEAMMPYALSFKKRNPLAVPTQKLIRLLQASPAIGLHKSAITLMMHDDTTLPELEEILKFLTQTKQVSETNGQYKLLIKTKK